MHNIADTWARLSCIRSSSKQHPASLKLTCSSGMQPSWCEAACTTGTATAMAQMIGLVVDGRMVMCWQFCKSASTLQPNKRLKAKINKGDLPWFSSASRPGLLSRLKPRSARAGPCSVAFSSSLLPSNRRAEPSQASSVARASGSSEGWSLRLSRFHES